jgi:hypothetical protein
MAEEKTGQVVETTTRTRLAITVGTDTVSFEETEVPDLGGMEGSEPIRTTTAGSDTLTDNDDVTIEQSVPGDSVTMGDISSKVAHSLGDMAKIAKILNKKGSLKATFSSGRTKTWANAWLKSYKLNGAEVIGGSKRLLADVVFHNGGCEGTVEEPSA